MMGEVGTGWSPRYRKNGDDAFTTFVRYMLPRTGVTACSGTGIRRTGGWNARGITGIELCT